MTDFERQILARIASLEKEVQRLKSVRFTLEQIEYFEALPMDATVGKDYVAWRFGCSQRAVKQGEAGTRGIPRVSSRPLKFIKRDVDAAFRKKSKSTTVLAAEFSAKARPVKRKSIIKAA